MKFNDPKQKEKLEEFYKKEEEDLVKILSERYEIPYIDMSTISVNIDALKIIDEDMARSAGVAAFSITGKKLKIIILSPKRKGVKLVMKDLQRKGYSVSFYMASKRSLEKAWDMYKEIQMVKETTDGVFNITNTEIENVVNTVNNIKDLIKLLEITTKNTNRYKISKILEIILAGAIAVKASDVHFEPEEKNVHMRFRLDGVLQDIFPFKHDTYKFILSRVKLLSGMKLNIKKNAQDGRFSIKTNSTEIEVRASVLPGEYKETVVMRILNPESISTKFEDLGIEPELFKILQKEIKKPNGMILTTGPTGSGKTTTLYAFLKKIYSTEIKIITIEDPIEYHLEGITQTQIDKKKGYTFLKGLRSSLRQDPDVMMIGEIRDSETAGVAIDSALTGHLVFPTLHTNNAAGVIPRLIDLKVNPKIISSALNISLAQRLIRKLCNECKKEDIPTEEERKIIESTILSIKKKRGINVNSDKIFRANKSSGVEQCKTCGGLGYKGRIGIFEGIITDKNIEDIVMKGNPSEREIKKAAENQNILNMKEDGILKVLQSITSIEELGRMVDLDEE
jgi:type IV pilus assembly protein PilB